MAASTVPMRMNRDDAQLFVRFIDNRRRSIGLADASVRRKRSWTDAQRAMARGNLMRELEVWTDLRQRINAAFRE